MPEEFRQPITAKIRVLHPAQEPLVDQVTPREYDHDHPIRFMMVGAGFFRKGGRELFRVFQKLADDEGLPVRLVIVSSLRIDSYAAHETEEDVAWAREIIAGKPEWLEYYEKLPNPSVLDLLKGADVGLLPTWADTYGLSVLEAQAAGCPVITTNVRALPEINNNHVGWLIRVPKDDLGEANYTTPEDRENLSQVIQDGLEHHPGDRGRPIGNRAERAGCLGPHPCRTRPPGLHGIPAPDLPLRACLEVFSSVNYSLKDRTNAAIFTI